MATAALGEIDENDVRSYLSTHDERSRTAAVYGVPVQALGQTGPSVSPINGVIAALAATEFMVAVTGMRTPTRLIEYRGWVSKVMVSGTKPRPDCYYCKSIRGRPRDADVERYLRIPHLRERRKRHGGNPIIAKCALTCIRAPGADSL